MAANRYRTEAARLQRAHADAVERIQARTDLTPVARRDRLRTVQDEHASKLADLQRKAAVETDTQRGQFYQQAFGAQDLPGDPGTRIVSVRDAADRASRINDPQEAAALLQRADLSGDEALARAVGERAFSQTRMLNGIGSAPWGDVVQAYAARRPAQADALTRLIELDSGSGIAKTMSDAAAFYLPTPTELQGPGGWQPAMSGSGNEAA